MPRREPSQHSTSFGTLSRRRFVLCILAASGATLAAACQAAPPAAAPTAAPSKPAGAPPASAPTAAPGTPAAAAQPAAAPSKPAAAQPTTAAPAPAAQPAAAAKPKSGGDLIFSTWEDPASLDPINGGGTSLNSLLLVYDTLVVQSKELKYFPGLAESWEVAPDGKAYTFKLKRNVKFHDGTPFNAQAVKFTLDRVTSPGTKATFFISLTGIYDTTEIVDEYTARVRLKQPFGPFLDAVSDGYHSIVSPTAVQKFGLDYDRNPVGTGPFIFREWASKSHVTLERNPDYAWGSTFFKHQGPAYLDRVTFRLVADPITRGATLETGEMHISEELPPDQLGPIRQNQKLKVMSQPIPGSPTLLYINTAQPMSDDRRVRQALSFAVKQEEMTKVIFQDALTPAHTILAPGTLGYDKTLEKLNTTDVVKARSLLEESGWKAGADGLREKDGKKLELSINIVSAATQAIPVKMAEVLQAQLRDVGMGLKINQMDNVAVLASITDGSAQMIYGWRIGTDPDILRPVFHSSFIGKSTLQRIRLVDEQLDKLFVDAVQETDAAKRAALYKQIQESVAMNALVVPLWYREAIVGTQAAVEGVTIDSRGWVQLYDAWLA